MLIQSNKEKNKKVAMHYRFLLLVIVAFFVAFISLAPAISYARVEEGNDGFNDLAGLQVVEEEVMLPNTDIRIFIGRLINAALGLIGIILVGLITYGGWMYMTSAGDATKVEKAKKIMQNAAIGLLIILASFGIVSFILRALGLGGGGGGGEGTPRYVDNIGVGALGNGIIQDHYPERNQTGVPINTSIIITFKDAIDPNSVCGASVCSSNNLLEASNIKIYFIASPSISPLTDEEYGALSSGEVFVSSTADNKTFIFTPKKSSNGMLGNQGKEEWYRVKLKNEGIKKANGEDVTFGLDNFYSWHFQTNGEMDLVPPKVSSIFPPADNDEDIKNEDITRAEGSVTIIKQPQVARPAKQDIAGNFRNYTIENQSTYQNCQGEGVAEFVIGAGSAYPLVVTKIQQEKFVGFNGESQIIKVGEEGVADISCGLRLIFNNYSELQNQEVKIDVALKQDADTLTIGNNTYIFGGNVAVAGIGASFNPNITVTNLKNAINDDNSLVDAECDVGGSGDCGSEIIKLTVKIAGEAGNNININSSREGVFEITDFTGGKRNVDSTTVGAPDVARNAIVQINFNEAINPIQIAGLAENLNSYIRVTIKDINSSGDYLTGEFMISNQYKTVEFRTDDLCGQNSCGENTYCLPAEANIKAFLQAATCKSGEICNADLNGIMDVAFNSLDGNGDGKMQGPNSAFNENDLLDDNGKIDNSKLADLQKNYGDNYTWSFWTSDQIDLESPIIEYSKQERKDESDPDASDLNLVKNGGQSTGAKITAPLLIRFNKLMMSASLKPGRDYPNDFYPDTEVPKEYAVFVNFSGIPLGYWVSKKDYDTADADTPKDGFPDKTEAVISHTRLGESSSYGFVLGSGVKDVYQNCYNPAGDTGADGQSDCGSLRKNDAGKSCCKGVRQGSVCYGF